MKETILTIILLVLYSAGVVSEMWLFYTIMKKCGKGKEASYMFIPGYRIFYTYKIKKEAFIRKMPITDKNSVLDIGELLKTNYVTFFADFYWVGYNLTILYALLKNLNGLWLKEGEIVFVLNVGQLAVLGLFTFVYMVSVFEQIHPTPKDKKPEENAFMALLYQTVYFRFIAVLYYMPKLTKIKHLDLLDEQEKGTDTVEA